MADREEYTESGKIKDELKFCVGNAREIARKLLLPSLLITLVAVLTLGGNVGVVKVDYLSYIPYHEIGTWSFVAYAAGCAALLLLAVAWSGGALAVIGAESEFGKLNRRDILLAGLRMLQFCMLALLAFGIVFAVLVYAAVRVTPWLWIAVGAYAVAVAIPLYIAEYEYMIGGSGFFASLRLGLRAMREQWGRVFVRLLIVCAAAVLLCAVVALPAVSLLMGIYDNATAVVMEGAAPTPIWVYVAEDVFIALGVLASLAVVFAAMVVLRGIYVGAGTYSASLAEEREYEKMLPA